MVQGITDEVVEYGFVLVSRCGFSCIRIVRRSFVVEIQKSYRELGVYYVNASL